MKGVYELIYHAALCKMQYLSDDARGPKITPGHFRGKENLVHSAFVSRQSQFPPSVLSVTFWVFCMSSLDKQGQTTGGIRPVNR